MLRLTRKISISRTNTYFQDEVWKKPPPKKPVMPDLTKLEDAMTSSNAFSALTGEKNELRAQLTEDLKKEEKIDKVKETRKLNSFQRYIFHKFEPERFPTLESVPTEITLKDKTLDSQGFQEASEKAKEKMKERFLMTGLFAETFGWVITSIAVALALFLFKKNYNLSYTETPGAMKNVLDTAMDKATTQILNLHSVLIKGDPEECQEKIKEHVKTTDEAIIAFRDAERETNAKLKEHGDEILKDIANILKK